MQESALSVRGKPIYGRHLHLDGAAALFIHPVQIGSGVGRLWRDLEEVAAGHTGKDLGKLRGLAAGGKIGN